MLVGGAVLCTADLSAFAASGLLKLSAMSPDVERQFRLVLVVICICCWLWQVSLGLVGLGLSALSRCHAHSVERDKLMCACNHELDVSLALGQEGLCFVAFDGII